MKSEDFESFELDEKQQKQLSKALTRYTNLLGFVASFMAAVGLALLIYQGFFLANQSIQKKLLLLDRQQKVELIRSDLNTLERGLTQYLSQPGLAQAVIASDRNYLIDKELALTNAFPDAVRVRIWKKNTATVAMNATPPLSFSTVDLILRVEQAKQIKTEAVQFEDKWLINIAVPILKEEQIVGSALVSFISGYLFNKLEKVNETDNDYILFQTFTESSPKIIYTSDNQMAVSFEGIDTLEIPDTNWQLYVMPGNAVKAVELVSIRFAIVVSALILILILFMTFLVSGRLQNNFNEDWRRFNSIYIHGEENKSKRFRFLFFKYITGIFDKKLELLNSQHKPVTVEKPTKPAPKKDKPLESRIKSAQSLLSSNKKEEVAAKTSDNFEVTVDVSPDIFKSYDIRGLVGKELNPDVVYMLGLSIGSEARARGLKQLVVAYDGRESSADFTTNVCRGIQDSGCDVLNIGMVPTPVLYYATCELDTKAGVMVTGGSLPGDYNGFKIILNNRLLIADELLKVRKRIEAHDLDSGAGNLDQVDIISNYIEAITSDIAIANPLKVVVDAGNGVTGLLAPQLIEALGCEVIRLNCAVDGKFPNHLPDPSKPEHLRSLVLKVQEENADVGVAFDGDGDRIQFVDNQGEIVSTDKILLILAKDVISRNPGTDVVFDVKSSRNLSKMISHYGGRPVLWKSGHPHIWQKLIETSALLAGDFSGHYFFKERWFGFDDGLYAAARVLEILGLEGQNLSELVDSLPKSIATKELRLVLELSQDKEALMANLTENAQFGDGNMTTIDGIRVDYADGWGLIRVSQTAHELVFRFEATTQEGLERIQTLFKREINAVNEQLKLPF